MDGVEVEIVEPGRAARIVRVAAQLELGRECEGVVLADPEVSRRHVELSPGPRGITLADLGSTNGTFVNGARLSEPVVLGPEDVVLLGRTTIRVLPGPVVTQTTSSATPAPAAPDPRPLREDLAALESDGAVIRYRPGSAGESAAPGYAAAVRRARRRLAGFGSEPWGVVPQICLVDPFPDPATPGEIVAEGTVVDAARGEIWIVVTPEFSPEPPERPLALFFGASLPAAVDLRALVEGYGMYAGEAPDPDSTLAGMDLPPLGSTDGELGSAMAFSFVRYVIERGGREDFLRLLSSAQPGRVDEAAQHVYGVGVASLEEAWLQRLRSGPPGVKGSTFVRMSLRYLRPHVRREAEMFVYMLLSLAFTTVFPFITRRLFDVALPSRRFPEVLNLLVILGVAFFVSLVAGLRRAYLSAYVSGSVVRELRARMFAKLQALSPSWFDRHQEGDVLSRFFSDVRRVEQGISLTLREGIFQMLSLAVATIVLLRLNLVLGVVVLLGSPLVALVYKGMSAGGRRRSMAVQEQLGAVLTVSSENYAAQPVVKAFALEAREIARFGRISERLFRSEIRLQLFGGLFGLSVQGIVTALRLVVLGLGAWMILQGRLTVGGMVAFLGLMGEVLAPVGVLTGLGQRLQEATGALVRIDDILEVNPDFSDAPDALPLPPLSREIVLADVSYGYTPDRRALEGVDCTIPAGARVAFVGPSGAGKSSILRLLVRFADTDEGAVLFDGRDIRTGTLRSLRGQVGVVLQDSFLFNTTIRENVRLGRLDASDEDVEAAARAAELHDFVATLPRGYETLVGEGGSRLSGGQRQRLAIARALLRDPRVLLLDEATSALDPRTERLIAQTLDRLAAGRTTVAVTHRLTSVTGYDRIFVVSEGRIVDEGTHGELVAHGGTYAALWAEQTGGIAAVEPPFDAPAALRRIPLFAGLGSSELVRVSDKLRSVELGAGESVTEGGGCLYVLRRGRAKLMRPGLDGRPIEAGELGPGRCFGLAAVLGSSSGLSLQADERAALLVLDDEALAGLAASLPSVAAALDGRATAGPGGGERLSRVSIGPGGEPSVVGPTSPPSPDLRRATGAMPATGGA